MHNFGVIRSAISGEVLRLALNYDNNQTYRANPGRSYQKGMLKQYMQTADRVDYENLKTLCNEMAANAYLKEAYDACFDYLK